MAQAKFEPPSEVHSNLRRQEGHVTDAGLLPMKLNVFKKEKFAPVIGSTKRYKGLEIRYLPRTWASRIIAFDEKIYYLFDPATFCGNYFFSRSLN